MRARGAGYVGVKTNVKEDSKGTEECDDVDISPVIEFTSKESAVEFLTSPEYVEIKHLRTDNLRFRLAVLEANLLPEGADTSKFGAYLSTILVFDLVAFTFYSTRILNCVCGLLQVLPTIATPY